MNTMNKLSFIVVLAVGLLFAGCNDMLEDVDPSTSISPEEALETAEGVDLVRASLYSEMRASMSFTTQNLIGPSALADESFVRDGASRYDALNYATGTSGTSHLGSYTAAYNVIQVANQLINSIGEDAVDAGTRDQYRGEAYAFRAYAYHMLVKVYGYEPGNYAAGPENWDLGVPIFTESVFEVEDIEQRPRATVDEVYDLILSDLDEAATLLAGSSNRTYANETFVEGMQARVNLFAGNWEEAAEHAQNTIDMGPGLVDDADDMAVMFNETAGNHPEAIFVLEVDSDTEPIAGSNVNNGPAAYTAQQWWAQLPTQYVLDLFDEDDYRTVWFKPCPAGAGCDAANDSEVASIKWNGDKGNFADDLPFMRVAEMYLILAEAEARSGLAPAAGAPALEELRDARNAGAIPAEALVDMDAFEDLILEERVRELHFEGHRFWDLKRLERHIPDPFGGDKIRSDSYRILAPIGNSNLNANPELVENPGY
jgi:starch-binding outer membrane protein, SusD/RagB family